MARSENNEAHGSGNVPATPAGAAAAAGGGGAPAAGSGKQEAAPVRGAEGQSVVRRLQSELMSLMMGGDSGVSVFPEGDNVFHWVGTNDEDSDEARTLRPEGEVKKPEVKKPKVTIAEAAALIDAAAHRPNPKATARVLRIGRATRSISTRMMLHLHGV